MQLFLGCTCYLIARLFTGLDIPLGTFYDIVQYLSLPVVLIGRRVVYFYVMFLLGLRQGMLARRISLSIFTTD